MIAENEKCIETYFLFLQQEKYELGVRIERNNGVKRVRMGVREGPAKWN